MSKNVKQEDSVYEEMYVENSVYITEVPDSYKNRKLYAPLNIKELTAIIPGTIKDIFIKKGQKVVKGEKLIILEAMKMRNIVDSPIDGEIKDILVKGEDIVRKGALLVEFK